MLRGTWSALAAVVLVLSLIFALTPNPKVALASTGINQELSFEGKIDNSSGINIPDGTYNMEFKIYSAATSCNPTTGAGCTLAWTEDWLVGSTNGGINFTSGTFQVNLGTNCPFSGGSCETYTNMPIDWNSYPLYLSLQVGNTSSCTVTTTFQANCGGDGEMKPYILLTSTPYSFNSGELGGLTASAFGQLAVTQTWTGINTFEPSTNSTSAFQVQDTSGATVLNTDTTANVVTVSGNLNLNQVAAPTTAPTLNTYVSGGILTGTYYYVVSYVASSGITNYGPVSAAIAPSAQNVTLNIPTSPSNLVIARNIYRSISPAGPFDLVGSVSDNTTTTFTDSNTSPTTAALDYNTTANIQQNGSIILIADNTNYNTALGIGSLTANATGQMNTAYGYDALQSNNNGFYNTASGYAALQANSSGSNNTAFGYQALSFNTTGSYNTATGNNALVENKSGSYNTATGQDALFNTTGSNNTALGYEAGYTYNSANANTTGSGNTFIGYQSGPGVASSSSLQNATAIGNLAVVDTSNALVLGSINGINNATSSTNVGIGTASPTQTLDVSGTALIQSSTNSSTAFQVQNTSGYDIITGDTTNSQLILGQSSFLNGTLEFANATNTNSIILTTAAPTTTYSLVLPAAAGTTGQCLQAGTVSGASVPLNWGSCTDSASAKQVTLIPAFAGAVFSPASGDGTNTGYMQNNYVTGLTAAQGYQHNFYQWSTDQTTAQDYDVIARYQLPSNFTSFVSGSWNAWVYATATGSGQAISYIIRDAAGDSCSTGSLALTAGTWTQDAITDPSTTSPCSFSANNVITIDFRFTAVQPSTDYVELGEVQFSYQ